MWMRWRPASRGRHARRYRKKRHLAGIAVHWRTGRLLLSAPGKTQRGSLFVAHLYDLRLHPRSHPGSSMWLAHNANFEPIAWPSAITRFNTPSNCLHFLPKQAPCRDESHPARPAAPPRDDHPQSPLSVDRRSPVSFHRIRLWLKIFFLAKWPSLPDPPPPSRLALCFGGGFI